MGPAVTHCVKTHRTWRIPQVTGGDAKLKLSTRSGEYGAERRQLTRARPAPSCELLTPVHHCTFLNTYYSAHSRIPMKLLSSQPHPLALQD